MNDYTVLNFTGPNARFHLTDPEGWVMRESYLLRAAREHGSGPSELPGNREMVGKGGPKWSPMAIESKPKPKKRNPAIAKMCPCTRHMITASQVEHRIATCWKCREEIRVNAKAQVRASR